MTYQPHHSEDATLKPVASETDAPLPHKEAPNVWCPCELHPTSAETQQHASGVMEEGK